MADWQAQLRGIQARAMRIPPLAWAVGGVIAVSLAVVFALEMNGPPYVALFEGLPPEQGGKVIAELQKLAIPYQLQGAGSIILVPAPDLAEARLQLGAQQVPEDDVSSAWDKLENAPMTASDLAQNTMAAQALESTLEQSIETMNGIRAAQVYIAMPPDTPFLADQPKPTASVVITADPEDAEAQGAAIANLVAGAVPGLAAAQVSVATTSGVTVYPLDHSASISSQFATVSAVETSAAARVAALLSPLVGPANFRTDVSANLDFTQEQIHQISYGPTQLISHQTSTQSSQTGGAAGSAGFGIPGALSNEPPAATTATAPPAPAPGDASTATAASTPAAGPPAASGAPAPPPAPVNTSKTTDQTYVTDQAESDITKPDWTVDSIAVSVVLNKAALGTVTIDQVKTAVAAAFAYPKVTVNVLAAPFQTAAVAAPANANLLASAAPLTRALLEVMAAAALLFGVALPVGRRLADVSLNLATPAPLPGRAKPVILPPTDFSSVREQASENVASVARLLQSWAEDGE
jgi:flagellar M-ring protein FliF